MNIIILGPQGSGKGTQARLLSEKLGFYYHENGAFCREIAKINPRIDEKINKKGEFIEDGEMLALLKDHFEKKVKRFDNIIFESFPRSINQYQLLKDWLKSKKTKIDYAVFLQIPEKETIRRLSARRTCENCGEVYNLITKLPKRPGICDKCGSKLIQRQDDVPQTIKRRLEIYRDSTEPLLAIFKKEGILIEIDGERPIGVISQDIIGKLQK